MCMLHAHAHAHVHAHAHDIHDMHVHVHVHAPVKGHASCYIRGSPADLGLEEVGLVVCYACALLQGGHQRTWVVRKSDLSAQELDGSSSSEGTPGQERGKGRPKTGSVRTSDLASSPSWG